MENAKGHVVKLKDVINRVKIKEAHVFSMAVVAVVKLKDVINGVKVESVVVHVVRLRDV